MFDVLDRKRQILNTNIGDLNSFKGDNVDYSSFEDFQLL